jgi:hypothetical protein
MSERADDLVHHWSGRFPLAPWAPQILAAAGVRREDVQRCALDGLQRENAAFGIASTAQFQREAAGHCHDILNAMLAIAGGSAAERGADLFAFVKLHAARRARQRFPLAGSLNAYRLAHKGYWTAIRECLLSCGASESEMAASSMMLSEFLLEFFDVVAGILTDAYLAEERLLLEPRARARVALIEDLMRGRPPGDIEARDLSLRCGIRAGATMAVAVARPLVPTTTVGDDARDRLLGRASELVETSLAARGFGTLVDRRDGAVLAIAAGETDTARGMATVLRASIGGRRSPISIPVGIGVSLDVRDSGAVPQAYQEAGRAVEFAEQRRPVVHVADVDLVELLLRRPDAATQRLIPAWAERLRTVDGTKSGALSDTIRAFADCNLSVKQTARRLDLHANTVYFRLKRIKQLTGVDPRSFSGASLLLTALRLLDARSAPSSGMAR